MTTDEDSVDGRDKAIAQLQGIVGLVKVRSWAEFMDRLVYILAALVGVGLVLLISAMIGWLPLLGLLVVAIIIWLIQLGWLFIVR